MPSARASPAPEHSATVLTCQSMIRAQVNVAIALRTPQWEPMTWLRSLLNSCCSLTLHSLDWQTDWLATYSAGGQLSADRLAVEHVSAQVVQVVRYGCAQAQVAHAVVAPCILPLLVTHPQHLHHHAAQLSCCCEELSTRLLPRLYDNSMVSLP